MNKTAKREEINARWQWKLTDIVESPTEFEKIYSETDACLAGLAAFRGKLSDRNSLLAYFKMVDEVSLGFERIYSYAMMNRDQNTKDTEAQSLFDRVSMLYVRFASTLSFAQPELTQCDEAYILACAKDPDFADYDRQLLEVIREKKHVLSDAEERLLANAGEIFGQFQQIFSFADNADLKLGTIKDEEGKDVELNHSRYGLFLQSKNREVRRAAYEHCYDAYKGLINTITGTYVGNVKKNVFTARIRGFNSALERAMFGENVPKAVYENLIAGVESNLTPLHRYVSYRKAQLGVEDLHFYDMYVPIVKGAELALPYEEAYQLVLEGLKPLGEAYGAQLKKAYDEGWIDVYNNDGKRSGAYSSGVYGVHPFVLLNYEKTTHDIFTIAHEMGHAMHSFYSSATQPYSKEGYTIFLAEVASTVNEVLLLRHIIGTTTDPAMRKYLLSYFLDMFRTTLFRQTMFAEFEFIAHSHAEKGKPLNHGLLCAEYEKLNKKYYGEDIVHDDYIKYEWARIPHFYRAFYVYKYATGITAAVNIAYGILKNGQPAVDQYLKFLSSGGSDEPIELLKIAGVDLTKKEPFEFAMQVFNDTLNELLAME